MTLRRWTRLLALALLALLAADLVGADCAGRTVSARTPAASGETAGADAPHEVPDCLCCTLAEEAAAEPGAARLAPAPGLASHPAGRASAGEAGLPYRPPRPSLLG